MTRYEASVSALPDLQELGRRWRMVNDERPGSWFVDWDWIGAWLCELAVPTSCRLVTLRDEGRVAALGVFGMTRARRHGLLRRVLALHATGDARADSIFVEHNGLAGESGLPVQARVAVLRALLDHTEGWDEVELRGVEHPREWLAAARACGLLTDVHDRFSPRLNLTSLARGPLRDVVRAGGARYQLRRAFRDYLRECGEPSVSEPTSVEDALMSFEEMRRAHQIYWEAKGQAGAFSSGTVNSFHKRMIAEGFWNGRTRLIRVCAGGEWIGTLYVFVHRGVACYYQSGYDYHVLSSGNRPGWLCMQLAVDHLRQVGVEAFDLLAGDQPYKKLLADEACHLAWIRCTRPRLRFRADAFVTSCFRRIRVRSRRTGEPTVVRDISVWNSGAIGRPRRVCCVRAA